MFSIPSLLLTGIRRTKCPRLAKIPGSDGFLPRLRNVLGENQPRGIGHWKRRSFCRKTSEIRNVEVDEDDELRAYQEEDSEPQIEEKKQKKEEIFQEISKGDPAILKNLKLLDLEIAFLKTQGLRVPEYLKKDNWEDLLQKTTLSQKRKCLAFLHLNEVKQLAAKEKAKIRRENNLKEIAEAGFHYYGIGGHTMFMRIYEKSLTRLLDLKHQLHPGLKIVLDCSYEDYMTEINVKECAKQIALCLYDCRHHRQPCQISVCNLNEDSKLAKLLPKFSPKFYEILGSNVYEENVLDVFPKERVVYLSPNAVDEVAFDPEDIYVIGAFVDKGNGTKVSVAKARRSRIRSAKLPIDSYVQWKQGTKSLPLNIVLKIMLDMGFYNDWNRAFTNLPRRCIRAPQKSLVKKTC